MLELQNISKTYATKQGVVHALRDVSLHVKRGEFVAVKGPSGCGKSTLLVVAGALQNPDAGIARLDGENLYAMTVEQRAKFRARRIGFVFQQFHLIPYLTVRENILAASSSAASPAAQERAQQLIERFQMAQRAMHLPGELSTGERQRTALARALMNEPGLLLADEPTGNLDFNNAVNVLQHLREFANAGGAVLLVTHAAEALGYADRVAEMNGGELVLKGSHSTTAACEPIR